MFDRQPANPRDSKPDPLKEILYEGKKAELAPGDLSKLIPGRVLEIARHKEKVEARQLPSAPGEVFVAVLEREYPSQITDRKAYEEWQAEIDKVRNSREQSQFRIWPEPPALVNKMHNQLQAEIRSGAISLNDRIFMVLKFRLYPFNAQTLFITHYDGEPHNGIGQDFYKHTLPAFAKGLGMRFIFGQNRTGNFSFFKDTLQRYSPDEIKPKYRELFPEQQGDDLATIQFLYPEDVAKYIGK